MSNVLKICIFIFSFCIHTAHSQIAYETSVKKENSQRLLKKLDKINSKISILYKDKIVTINQYLKLTKVTKHKKRGISIHAEFSLQYDSIPINVEKQIAKILNSIQGESLLFKYSKVLNRRPNKTLLHIDVKNPISEDYNSYSVTPIYLEYDNWFNNQKVYISNTKIDDFVYSRAINFSNERYVFTDSLNVQNSELRTNRIELSYETAKLLVDLNFFGNKQSIYKKFSIPLKEKVINAPIRSNIMSSSFDNSKVDENAYVANYFKQKFESFIIEHFKQYQDSNKLTVLKEDPPQILFESINSEFIKDKSVFSNIQIIYRIIASNFTKTEASIIVAITLDGKYVKRKEGAKVSAEFISANGIDFEKSPFEDKLKAYGISLYDKFESYLNTNKNEGNKD